MFIELGIFSQRKTMPKNPVFVNILSSTFLCITEAALELKRFLRIFLLGFIILLIQYYSVICRPSDHTVGRPRAKIRTQAWRSRGRDTTPRPPHLLNVRLGPCPTLIGAFWKVVPGSGKQVVLGFDLDLLYTVRQSNMDNLFIEYEKKFKT